MPNQHKKNVQWVCRKCGRRTLAKERPGALAGGKCRKSPSGTHSYVRA